jgi:hypothetical protein
MSVRPALLLSALLALAGCPGDDGAGDDAHTDPDPTDEGQVGDTEVGDTEAPGETDSGAAVGDTDSDVGDTDSDLPPADSDSDAAPADSDTEVPPADSDTDVLPADSDTEIPPADSDTEVPPVDSDTDVPPPDADHDGWRADVDCDDADAAVHPGAQEVCNGLDDDCDAWVDNADPSADGTAQGITPVAGWFDDDHDGYGNPNSSLVLRCGLATGFASNGDDCADWDAAVHPGATEVCDQLDDDCDGLVDDDDDDRDPSGGIHQWLDGDGDGYGDPATETLSCAQAPGTVRAAGDCDDTRGDVRPDATEVCDDVDDDCDGLVDDADDSLDAHATGLWAAIDRDGDGHGVGDVYVAYCTVLPAGYAPRADDCDDDRADVHPDAAEVCDRADDDCDGAVDDADDDLTGTLPEETWVDVDDDGWGDATQPTTRHCAAEGPGWTGRPGDCADGDGAVSPDAAEVCDGWDDDCDGLVDMDDDGVDLSTAIARYVDADLDGYGDPEQPEVACWQSAGWSDLPYDCDDADVAVHQGATETCDGVDDDCDGYADLDDPDISPDQLTATWIDEDGDGYGAYGAATYVCTVPDGWATQSGDCDDQQRWAHPGGTEVCDGTDDDCVEGGSEAGLATWDLGYGDPVDLTSALEDLSAYDPVTLDEGGRLHLCAGTWRPLAISADVDVIGHGAAVIRGLDRWPGVQVAGEQVTASVSDVTIEEGWGGLVASSVPGQTGGTAAGVTCVDATATSWLMLQDVTFGLGSGFDGGALHVDGCSVDVFGGSWTDLVAYRGGGALVAHGTLRMIGTRLSGVAASGDGGAFYLAEGGALETIDVDVQQPTAGGSGGAYYLSDGTSADLQCTGQAGAATGASAAVHGGGAYLAGTGATLAVTGCGFGYDVGDWTHNGPEDVWVEALDQAFDGYGIPATFSCDASGCTAP